MLLKTQVQKAIFLKVDYQLPPSFRNPRQELIFLRVFTKFSDLHANWEFIMIFTIAHQASLSLATWIQSLYLIPLRPILILSSHVHLSFKMVSFIHVSSPKSCAYFSPPLALNIPSNLFALAAHTRNISWSIQNMKLLIIQVSRADCYFQHFKLKRTPRHSIL
jgi:hypothetical protein